MSTSFAKTCLSQTVLSSAASVTLSAAALLCLGAIAPSLVAAQSRPAAAQPTQPAQPIQPAAKPLEPTPSLEPTRPNSLENSVFSISGGQRLMAESMSSINKQNYDLAVTKLQDARQVFNQLSNFYQELTTSFSGIDNRISDSHRRKALRSAQLRDEATYQLAVVYRAKNQPELAVPLLVQLIRSQAPTRDLGQQAYQQLFELGFVDTEYVRPSANAPK